MQSRSNIPVADSWEDDEVEFDLNAGAAVDARARQQPSQTPSPAITRRPNDELDPALATKIAQRKKKDEEQLERQRVLQDELEALPEAARKLRLSKLAEEADLQHVKDWLGGPSAPAPGLNNSQTTALSLDNATPRTKAEFDRFAQGLVERLSAIRRGAKTPRSYILFLKEFLHGLFVKSDVLSSAEVSELVVYIQDTLKSEREQRERSGSTLGGASASAAGAPTVNSTAHAAPSKGPKKATIRVERGDEFAAFAVSGNRRGSNALANLDDDDDDFM
jgi:hypothetical protein